MIAIKVDGMIAFRSSLCKTSIAAKALLLGVVAAADGEGLADSGIVCKSYDLTHREDLCAELAAADAIIPLDNEVVAIKQWPGMKHRKDIKSKSAFPTERKKLKIQDDQYVLIDE